MSSSCNALASNGQPLISLDIEKNVFDLGPNADFGCSFSKAGSGASEIWDFNNAYNPNGGLTGYPSPTGNRDKYGTNPLLNNPPTDFHLMSSSPLLNQATGVTPYTYWGACDSNTNSACP